MGDLGFGRIIGGSFLGHLCCTSVKARTTLLSAHHDILVLNVRSSLEGIRQVTLLRVEPMVTEASTIEETLVLVGHWISAPIRVRLVVLDAEEDLD